MASNSKSSAGKNFTVIAMILAVAAAVAVVMLLNSKDETSDLTPEYLDTEKIVEPQDTFTGGSDTATGSIEEIMLDTLGAFEFVSDSDGFTFEVYEKGVVLASSDREDEKITIPSQFAGKPVLCIGEFGTRSSDDGFVSRRSGFMGNSTTKELIVPEGVIVTGDMCFGEMGVLEKLTLPASLKYYVGSALGTPWFEALSDEFCMVGDGILIKYNGEGGDVRIPSGTRVISSRAMSESVYTQCPDITTLTLPSTLEYICDDAIKVAYGLKELAVPESVVYIGARGINASSAVADIEKIVIGSSLKYASCDSFGFSGMLPSQWNEDFTIVGDGVLIAYNGRGSVVLVPDGVKVVACPLTGAQKVILPNSVVYVGDGAFESVSEVALPDGLKIVGKEAFRDSAVGQILLPDSVRYIGFNAFKNSAGLSEVAANGVQNIGANAFSGCTVLSKMECGSTLSYIGQRAFNASGMVKFNVPERVKYVDKEAFMDCSSLNVLNIYGMETQLGEDVIMGDAQTVIYCTKGSVTHKQLEEGGSIKFVAE